MFTVVGLVVIVPLVPLADSGWYLTVPLLISGSGLGLLVSQLNNYTLSPITDERVSEAAGANSAAGSFGLAFAGAIMLATLAVSFTVLADSSSVLTTQQQEQVSTVLEDDAELMSNTGLEALLVEESPEVSAEMIRINTEARHLALQVALLIRILAGVAGILNSFRMRRLPDPVAAGSGDTVLG